jgi:chromosomal replication initiator protein
MAEANRDFIGAAFAEGWERTCRRLRAEYGADVFNSWFHRLALDSVVAGVANLSVPTRFLKSWIQANYQDKILATLRSELPEISAVAIEIRSPARLPALRPAVESTRLPTQSAGGAATTAARTPFGDEAPGFRESGLQAKPATILDLDALGGARLDKRMTFATFHVGKSNHFAHAAATRVANAGSGEPAVYNPLYFHAAVGLGKTHLLQAIAHAALERGRRVIYLTAENFMYRFAQALKSQNALAFKDKLRGIDMLVIDDAQFLTGKAIQNEFCHTLAALIDAGRQVVVAADRPPAELENLDERVRSRLMGGLSADIGPLDEEMRLNILRARVAAMKQKQPAFDVPAPVIAYVAKVVDNNGRDLEGAVSRLLGRATLTGVPLTVETAEDAIRDLVRAREPKRVKIEDIQKLVASHYNVSRADILSSRRTAVVVRPRQIAMYLAKVLTPRSLPEIGRRFGGRDHTTVLHAVRKIEGLTGLDGALNQEIELLKRLLSD